MLKGKFLLKVFTLLLLQGCYSNAHSQEKIYLEFSTGVSLPLPPFSQKDIEKTGAGYAKPGGLINLRVGRRIGNESFDLGVAIRANINGFDTKPITESYEKNNPGNYQDWDRKVKGWQLVSLMPGIDYRSFLNKKTQFKIGLYIGAAYAQSQEFTLTGNSVNGSFSSDVVLKQKNADAFTLSTSIQAGLCFPLTDILDLVINTDYFFLKPSFRDVEATSYGVTNGPVPGGSGAIGPVSIFHMTRKYSFVQNMNTFNLGTGLKIKF